ncbi:hypothetical protein R1flu_007945 [Riccia fluitans]|uniref:Geranylgeranyl transferase type-2 subunit alpha n=1 Tax=Riccia fluitans TaxID=41844 RepID=A0ABD1XEC8_9MARC
MHGRKRLPVGHTPDRSKDQAKREKLKQLLSDTLRDHHEKCYTKEALKKNAQLLELNPEFYTGWNYRKLAVRHLIDAETDEAARKNLLDEELLLVERALQVNVKSYGAWYHRKWVIEYGLSPLDHEFMLLRRLLKADARNFHGWNYRRFAIEKKGVTAEEELDYSTEKINENFSNYSAWHYRSTLLSRVIRDKKSKEEILDEEYKLVNQAYFTEPDDQSAWFYNTWLLGETKADSDAEPQVAETWPENGSSISVNNQDGAFPLTISYKTIVNSEQSFTSRTLPLVITFKEMVSSVVAMVRSQPGMENLGEITWRPLSAVSVPSKTWVADLPIQLSCGGEYTVFLEVSSPPADQVTSVSFKLIIASGDSAHPRKEMDPKAFSWPGKLPSEGELEADTASKLVRLNMDESTAEAGCIKQDSTVLPRENWQEKLLEAQIEILRDLLELERNSKWPLLTLARVLAVHGSSSFTEEVLELYKLLSDVDPDHGDYYKAQHSCLYIDKITRSRDGLKKLWWDCQGSLSSGWLRCNELGLHEFKFVERLLWVQRLDLSHNQLRTLNGLEALQLLEALDVSHNKLPSVTSLASLRLISGLQYLSISHNELGSHPVDFSRYSFPSALTNQAPDHHGKGSGNIDGNWDIQAVFGGMDLKVLEIAGNTAASNEKFRKSILKALPSLKLLDGEEV